MRLPLVTITLALASLMAFCGDSEPADPAQTEVTGMGACQHIESDLCFERQEYATSNAGCTDTEIERHLPDGCPVEGRVARCDIQGGQGIFWAYNSASKKVAKDMCEQESGEYKEF